MAKNNSLQFSPINELKLLREKALISCENCDVSLLKTQLNKVVGDQLEIDLSFDIDEIKKGIVFRKSDDGVCQAMLYFDPVSKSIVFDKTQDESGENVVLIKVPFSNQKNANVRIFLDKSMVEIYVNNELNQQRAIYNNNTDKNLAMTKLAHWYDQVEKSGFKTFSIVVNTIMLNYRQILNYFDQRSTNAAAESFNAKIKNFRNHFRGVRNTEFFLYRLTRLFA